MGMHDAVTVGANLKVDRSPEARALSKALTKYIEKTQLVATGVAASAAKTLRDKRPDCRVFLKAGAPATNASADSPGGDLCLVYDTTNNDLYLISSWSAATTFTATKILD